MCCLCKIHVELQTYFAFFLFIVSYKRILIACLSDAISSILGSIQYMFLQRRGTQIEAGATPGPRPSRPAPPPAAAAKTRSRLRPARSGSRCPPPLPCSARVRTLPGSRRFPGVPGRERPGRSGGPGGHRKARAGPPCVGGCALLGPGLRPWPGVGGFSAFPVARGGEGGRGDLWCDQSPGPVASCRARVMAGTGTRCCCRRPASP